MEESSIAANKLPHAMPLEGHNGIPENKRHLPRQTATRTQEHKNTDVYISLEQAIFDEGNDKFHSATAKTVEEARKLIDIGFQFV